MRLWDRPEPLRLTAWDALFWIIAAFCISALIALFGCPPAPLPGEPLAGLDEEQLAAFERGKAIFKREFTPQTGLGPLFNASSCAECHEAPVLGGAGDEVETHESSFGCTGCDMLVRVGGPVVQSHSTPELEALGVFSEPVAEGARTGQRSTPLLFGLGLLEAVPDTAIRRLADRENRVRGGVRGRPHVLPDGRIGRFGRKAAFATLHDFNLGALLEEMGVTSAEHPIENTVAGRALPDGVDFAKDPEISPEEVRDLDAFVSLLAPVSPLSYDRQGAQLFAKTGCSDCHVPSLPTRWGAPVHAYSDLLLHDMGEGLADICFGDARPREFRTAPLMGLRLRRTFLHDGRAKTIEEAVRAHAGQAQASEERFDALEASEKETLLAFLRGL